MEKKQGKSTMVGLRRRAWVCGLLLLALAALAAPVLAGELVLAVRKEFGYNMGSQIQGRFVVYLVYPEDQASVTFTLDGEVLGVVTEAPFEVAFNTDDYAPGWHKLSGMGTSSSGQTLVASPLEFEFVSSSEAGRGTMRIVGPVLALVIGGMLFAAVGPLLSRRKSGAAATRYDGVLGGTVCPKCGRPFGLHVWALNISLVGKFDRCPHCGKWSFVRRMPREVLEAAEVSTAGPTIAPEPDADVQRKKQIDDSRYVG